MLAGLNGSGKTSVIEAVRLALGQRYGLRPLPAYDFRIEVEGRNRAGENLKAIVSNHGHIVRMEDGTEQAVDEQMIMTRLDYGSDWFFSSWRDPALSFEVDLQEVKNFGEMHTDRTKELTFEMVRDFLVRADVQATYNHDEKQIRNVRALYQRLADAWNMFFPNRPATFVTRAVGDVLTANGFAAPAGKSKMPFALFLQRDHDQKLLALNDLSSGELEIFCFLGVLVSKIPQVDQVYIDEPELHLNQQWHSVLIHALRTVNPSAQFIVATHSPEIWNSVLSSQRFYIRDGRIDNMSEGAACQ